MYHGITGKKLDAEIFIGPVFFQLFKHQVRDKINYRGYGRIEKRTGQPIKGKKQGGGLKLGEMERDTLISHGTSAVSKDMFCNLSDGFDAVVCKNCGTLIIDVADISSYQCNLCRDKVSPGKIKLPGTLKLIMHYLSIAGIFLKFKLASSSEIGSKILNEQDDEEQFEDEDEELFAEEEEEEADIADIYDE